MQVDINYYGIGAPLAFPSRVLAALMTHAALARQPTGREDFSTVITMKSSIVNTMELLETAIKLHGIYYATAHKLVALTTRAALARQPARRGGF